jgi:hypothetical protein
MHQSYFDPDTLTDEQRARWDWAIAEYNKIVERNVERQISRMTPLDKANLLQSFPMYQSDEPSIDKAVRTVLHLFYGMSGGAQGDPRSALFARLLTGKQPLRAPPPSTFHQPWYEVIEEDGPFAVMLSDAHVERATAAAGEPEVNRSICLDHCPWTVTRMNDAAQRLFALQEQLDEKCDRERDGPAASWTPDFLEQVLKAYRDGPELLVQHEEWPPYRLRLEACPARDDSVRVNQAVTAAELAPIDTVFDTQALRISRRRPAAEAGTEAGHASQESHERLGWRLEKTS